MRCGVRDEESEVSDADEAGREEVQEEPVPSPVAGGTEELDGWQGHRLETVPLACPDPVERPAVSPARGGIEREAPLASLHADEPINGERHPVSVPLESPQVLAGPGDRRLAVHHPVVSREREGGVRELRRMWITWTRQDRFTP